MVCDFWHYGTSELLCVGRWKRNLPIFTEFYLLTFDENFFLLLALGMQGQMRNIYWFSVVHSPTKWRLTAVPNGSVPVGTHIFRRRVAEEAETSVSNPTGSVISLTAERQWRMCYAWSSWVTFLDTSWVQRHSLYMEENALKSNKLTKCGLPDCAVKPTCVP